MGTRTIAAIKLAAPDPSWYNGPLYAATEVGVDEDDFEACTLEQLE